MCHCLKTLDLFSKPLQESPAKYWTYYGAGIISRYQYWNVLLYYLLNKHISSNISGQRMQLMQLMVLLSHIRLIYHKIPSTSKEIKVLYYNVWINKFVAGFLLEISEVKLRVKCDRTLNKAEIYLESKRFLISTQIHLAVVKLFTQTETELIQGLPLTLVKLQAPNTFGKSTIYAMLFISYNRLTHGILQTNFLNCL